MKADQQLDLPEISEMVVEFLHGELYLHRLRQLKARSVKIPYTMRGRTNAEWRIIYRRCDLRIWATELRPLISSPESVDTDDVGF